MDDESEPSTAQNQMGGGVDEKSDETDDQLALVPSHFFKKQPPKPGMRETVEVVNVYENECSIKCVYDEDKDKEEGEEEEGEGMEQYAESEPEDEMMG